MHLQIFFLVFISALISVTMSCFPKQDDDGYGGDKDEGYGGGKEGEKGGGYGDGDKLFGYTDHGYVDEGFGHTRYKSTFDKAAISRALRMKMY